MAEKPSEPHWKKDFSVDWEETSYISRREFARYLALGSVLMAAGTTFLALRLGLPRTSTATRLKVADLDSVPPGGSLVFEYPVKGRFAILCRHADGNVAAFSQKCTHLGCAVYYAPESGKLECPCHEGFFDARTGDVLAGPPQRALPKVELEVVDGRIYAIGGGEA